MPRANIVRRGKARGDRHGLRLHPERVARGEQHYRAKLTEARVRAARRAHEAHHVGVKRLARRYGVNRATMWNALHGVTWKHVASAA